jgi:hypothetical protein
MFYLPSDTATAHAVSSYTCWSHVWISDMRFSSFTRISINEHCQNMPLPVIFSCCSMTKWLEQAMWFSFWCETAHGTKSSYSTHCSTAWHLLVIPRCSWL